MTKCECPVAGYCNRHHVSKASGWHKLCQTRNDYFDAWEAGHGPGQPISAIDHLQRQERREKQKAKQARLVSLLSRLRSEEDTGLGDTVERLLAKAGARQVKRILSWLYINCGCTDRQKWLNDKFRYPSDRR